MTWAEEKAREIAGANYDPYDHHEERAEEAWDDLITVAERAIKLAIDEAARRCEGPRSVNDTGRFDSVYNLAIEQAARRIRSMASDTGGDGRG